MTWSVGAGLEGKGVIVTGATGGIGKAVAEAFATTGAKVMAVDLDQAKVDEVVAGLEGSGHVGVAAEPARPRRRTQRWSIARSRRARQPLRAWPTSPRCCAARGSLDEVTEEDWDFQHDINLKAAFFLRAGGRQRDDRAGQGRPDHPLQLAGLVDRRLRRLGGVRRDQGRRDVACAAASPGRSGRTGITVNCVSPGQVHTPMLMTGLSPEVYESMKKQTPLGYVAEPEEMAGPVVFLASDHAELHHRARRINASGGFLMY